MAAFIKTNYPNVMYREHKKRLYLGSPDRYFIIRYRSGDTRKAEAVGWRSEGMNAKKASQIRSEITANIRLGKTPQSVADMRNIAKIKREKKVELQRQQEKENITFGDFFENYYLPWAETNKKSWKHDKQRYFKHLKNNLGDFPLKDIDTFLLEQLKEKLSQNLAPATVKHCIVLIRQAFNKTILWQKFTGRNPTKGVTIPKLDNERFRFLSIDEANSLLSILKQKAPTIHDMAFVSLYSGLRFGEVANLTINDIDFTSNIIYIRGGKTGSRHAFMTAEVADLFKRRCQNQADFNSPIFANTVGTKMTRVPAIFKQCVEELGLNKNATCDKDKIVFHSLRHTFASWLAQRGVPLFTIQVLMGHKTIKMTERYAHLCTDHKKVAINTLSGNFLIQRQNDNINSIQSK